MCGVHSSLPYVNRNCQTGVHCTCASSRSGGGGTCPLQGRGGARAPVPQLVPPVTDNQAALQFLILRDHCMWSLASLQAYHSSSSTIDEWNDCYWGQQIKITHMKAPMEKWTKSTFYSATANEVSNGKNGLSPRFGQLFLGNLFLWLSPLFDCALHIRCH